MELNLRELQRMSSREIKATLPCYITCDGQRIAMILSPEGSKALFQLNCMVKDIPIPWLNEKLLVEEQWEER